MNFKGLLKHKKMLAGSLVSLVLGNFIGFTSLMPTDEYNKLVSNKDQIVLEIENTNQKISDDEQKLASIKAEQDKVTTEITAINDEKERLAQEKVEAERIAKEKAEAEAKKQAELEEKRQEQIASNQSSSSNNSSNSGNSNNSSSSSNSNSSSSSSSSSNSSGSSNQGSGSVSTPKPEVSKPLGTMVWKTATGKKYHSHNNCGNSQTAVQVSLDSAKNSGLTACKKCY